ncbi:MAG TPA: hypothetical protein IAB46_05045 [Candidatus Scybalocola faecigallinarum]|uniref:Uncharacterized protein n=1 Tax=Candidatus Scybalocola faecigallinarum TaxID=2840941 RepID=A0A9D1F3Q0_9FIRM|nr:hypothetical protein [Candidatus Scybalocola faecigallinarum]
MILLDWQDLWAFKYIKAVDMEEFFRAMESPNPEAVQSYMEKYKKMSPQRQGALGYIGALAGISRHKGEHGSLIKYPFVRVKAKVEEYMIYKICKYAFKDQDTRLFYTDEAIRNDWTAARKLVSQITKLSRGLADVKAEYLGPFKSMDETDEQRRWGITFALRKRKISDRDIVRKMPECKEEFGEYVFIRPVREAGDCTNITNNRSIMGECAGNSCFVLAVDAGTD